MAFDDLEDEESEEESSPGDEALDDLAGTLSGDQSSESNNTTEKQARKIIQSTICRMIQRSRRLRPRRSIQSIVFQTRGTP